MAAELEDLLVDFEGPARWKRLAFMLIGLVLMLVAGFAAYDTLMANDATRATPPQTVEVRRGALSTSVSLTGSVAAQSTSQLNFESAGTVSKVNAGLGQEVKQGDVLAEIESVTAVDAVKQADLNLQAAQIRLNDLTKPATTADTASADQSVLTAQSSLDKAEEDLRKLKQGPTAAESANAQQAVSQATSALAQAQSARDKLRGPSATSERTSSESAVNQAQSALQGAQSGLYSAENAIVTAQAGLFSAESALCPQTGVGFCGSRAAPISSSDESAMLGATSSADKAAKASAVIQANAAYKNALAGRNDAASKLDSARRELATTQARLASTPAGPSASEVAAADAAITSARHGLDSARAKLSDLLKGPEASAVQSAQSTVESARAGLTAARAKREQTYAGAKPADIELQQNAVALSQLSVKKAQDDLAKTKLVAPFDGTIAALTVQAGDRAQGAGATGDGSSTAAITINTPNALRLDLTISESDLAKVKPGLKGIASFSGLEGAALPVEIESVGTLPSTNQGVVTYQARARLLLLDGAISTLTPPGAGQPEAVTLQPAPAAPSASPNTFSVSPGQNTTSGSSGAIVSQTPVTQQGASSSTAVASRPAPGMQAQVTMITDSRAGVLIVPARAVSREGLDSVVKVQKDDGSVETVKVRTGLSNGTQVEITEGLTEGQKVQLPAVAVASGSGSKPGGAGGDVQFIDVGPGPGGGGAAGPGQQIIINKGP